MGEFFRSSFICLIAYFVSDLIALLVSIPDSIFILEIFSVLFHLVTERTFVPKLSEKRIEYFVVLEDFLSCWHTSDIVYDVSYDLCCECLTKTKKSVADVCDQGKYQHNTHKKNDEDKYEDGKWFHKKNVVLARDFFWSLYPIEEKIELSS